MCFDETMGGKWVCHPPLRHSLRDRLGAIECPADIIDAIGGWTTEGVGHQYGQGHSLTVMHGWMERLTTKVKEP